MGSSIHDLSVEVVHDPPKDKKILGLPFVLLITSITALGGFLFGYDNGAISGSIGFLKTYFKLSPASTGWVTSSLMIGCLIGTIVTGKLGDLIGRKKILLICALLFAISSAGLAVSSSLSWLVTARIGLGFAIGMELTLAPLYIAEVSPARIRGRLVSFNQLFNTVGNLAIFSVSAAIANTHSQSWNVDHAWRWIFGSGAVPAFVFFVLLFFVPESPRWLLKKGQGDQALKVLEKINGPETARAVLKDITQTIEQKSESIAQLWKPGLRKTLIIAIVIAFSQQITGINAVIYYAPEIFQSAGAGSNAAMLSTVLVGVVLVTFTLLSIWLIDKIGRKALLLIGSGCMAISLICTGYLFGTEDHGGLILTFLLIYVAAFSISFGTVSYVVISEFFPTRIRGLAASVGTFALLIGQYLVAQFFPILVSTIGSSMTFYIFAVLSLLAFFFTVLMVPETKGKSLEEIEKAFSR